MAFFASGLFITNKAIPVEKLKSKHFEWSSYCILTHYINGLLHLISAPPPPPVEEQEEMEKFHGFPKSKKKYRKKDKKYRNSLGEMGDKLRNSLAVMHLSLAFPGIDPRDTPRQPPGT